MKSFEVIMKVHSEATPDEILEFFTKGKDWWKKKTKEGELIISRVQVKEESPVHISINRMD